MADRTPLALGRALRYVVATAGLAGVIGFFREGSISGALVLGVAVGIGVAAGLVFFELISRS
ncbi:hypothetical protein [Halobellus rufus]|uniref:hypothetical protein n=1 Tax=Halobellus rufus TaxID=1448860 RepID=UPI0006795F85|nr:hypothetical protein [Halobellus rufus]